MPGKFADLRPDSEARMKIWEENAQKIRELLEEINNDVFNGEGKFSTAHYGVSYHTRVPISVPNTFLEIDNGSIAVCTSNDIGNLRVIVELYGSNKSYIWWTDKPEHLDILLTEAVKELVK